MMIPSKKHSRTNILPLLLLARSTLAKSTSDCSIRSSQFFSKADLPDIVSIHSRPLNRKLVPSKLKEVGGVELLDFRGGSDKGDYWDYGDGGRRYDYNYDEGDERNYRDFDQSGKYEDDYYYSAGEERDREKGKGPYYDDDYKSRSISRDSSRSASSKNRSKNSSPLDYLPDVIRTGNKKIGMILLGGGLVFTMLGISLFFNKTLMRLGNLLFIAGVPMTIGPGRTTGYFLQPKKARATACLASGIFLVFIGWPIFGIALEIFGLLNLFGNMFPVLKILIKQVPVVGSIFDNDSGRKKTNNTRKKTSANSYREGNYYDKDYNNNWDRDGGPSDGDYGGDRYY